MRDYESHVRGALGVNISPYRKSNELADTQSRPVGPSSAAVARGPWHWQLCGPPCYRHLSWALRPFAHARLYQQNRDHHASLQEPGIRSWLPCSFRHVFREGQNSKHLHEIGVNHRFKNHSPVIMFGLSGLSGSSVVATIPMIPSKLRCRRANRSPSAIFCPNKRKETVAKG